MKPGTQVTAKRMRLKVGKARTSESQAEEQKPGEHHESARLRKTSKGRLSMTELPLELSDIRPWES